MPAAAYAGAVTPPFSDTEKIIGMIGTTFDNTPVNIHQVQYCREVIQVHRFALSSLIDHAFLSFLTLKVVLIINSRWEVLRDPWLPSRTSH